MLPRCIPRPIALIATLVLAFSHLSQGQLVILPAPRLLTVMPMGAKAGSTLEVTITGDNIDEDSQLVFSNPQLSAQPKLEPSGTVAKNKFVVTVPADVQEGVYDARLITRLGVSSARCFSISQKTEVTRLKPNTSLETAMALETNSICNAFTTARAVDFYSFRAVKGQRFAIDCAAHGIDSKLTPVVIVADKEGRDIRAERQSGLLEFTAPDAGQYVIKIHGLTYQGGAENFYRLALTELKDGEVPRRQTSTRSVSSASSSRFPLLPESGAVKEIEPNDKAGQAQKIQPPCLIHGNFAKAGDVDSFEFEAKKGEVWWIEVLSERLGLPTDPFVLIQQVSKVDGVEKLVDVAEFNDIASPVKLSTNGYAYDGAPYDAGSPDALGRFEAKQEGVYRLQIRDLFGGTRADPKNIYRLHIRRAAPDFTLAAWALHMELRNGDRAALSKPVALRGGATMGFDVVVVRRDGFDGEIELFVENLPAGVTAAGLKIPANKAQGHVLLTAADNAPRGISFARIFGKAKINGEEITRDCAVASMVWPVKDASGEIPNPRLMADFPVSVGGSEMAPLTIQPANPEIYEATAGTKLKIPLKMTWRGDFSGGTVKLKPLGGDFSALSPIDITAKTPEGEIIIDLAQLKTPPGDYAFAVHGGVVAKYSYNPAAVKEAERFQKEADLQLEKATADVQRLASAPKAGSGDTAPEAGSASATAAERLKAAEAAKVDAARRLKAATDASAPKDIVDIVFSEPIRVRVTAVETK